jgi:hypothetical protein
VVPRARQLFPVRRGFFRTSKEPRRFFSTRVDASDVVDRIRFRNPNIALLERRRALKILHALDVADAGVTTAKPETSPRIEAQSADDDREFRQAILRRLRT